MAEYIGVRLSDELVIKKLYTVHYYEYSKRYSFPGERHDFWEFVYADKGEVYAVADDTHHLLKQGGIIFHKPGEWHTVYANGTSAPNIAIVTFECTSDKMKFFENKILTVGQEQKRLISKIIATKSITLRELADYSGTNRTAIENIFRDSFGMGAVEYFLRLKIELAKKYLREDNYNVTQIAEILGKLKEHLV